MLRAASSATAVETVHGIVDKQDRPFHPSADQRVAALVYSASARRSEAKVVNDKPGAKVVNDKLPLLERSLLINW
jgi:hypothetical protein